MALLLAVYLVAKASTPDPTTYLIPGYNVKATLADYGDVLFRNSLVLALHALACVAGFMAGQLAAAVGVAPGRPLALGTRRARQLKANGAARRPPRERNQRLGAG